ncbi:MAG: hypothetical protein H8E66_06510 [Planctomycetes bacterium]|nr:hypothetical protein [Planctomycetota bacterium]
MRPRSARITRPLLVASAIIVVLVLAIPQIGLTQQAALNSPLTSAISPNEFLGVTRCERCHQAPTQADIDSKVIDFVLLNESKVWASDVHSKAFEFIDPTKSDLGKQICDKLGIANIHESRACLSCHSDWRPEQQAPPATYERGVACESCHGASENWDVPHSKDSWRAISVVEKYEKFGMIDVRNPIKRAEQCFGCHIGNVAEGKIITHEMYAAGHPPLPGIEIESFAAQMPRHWRYLDEKIGDALSRRTNNDNDSDDSPFVNFQEFLDENHAYLKPQAANASELVLGHDHRSAAVVLGGVVALRESIELMRDLASEDRPGKHTWPELATFDCRSCHHELTTPSRRQEQRTASIPGRPMMSSWPTALVRLAIRHVSADRASYDKSLEDFQAKLRTVQSELMRSPFGSPSRVHAACSELSAWITAEVVEPVSAQPFDDRAVTDAINVLIVIGSTEQHDYDSARQIAWALRMLSCGTSRDEPHRSIINRAVETLATELRLDFPNGPTESCLPVSDINASREILPIVRMLSTSLTASTEFDSELFRQKMQQLRESLR